MAVTLLRRWAAASTPAVFVAQGLGAADRIDTLRCRATLDCVASPRAADILLVAGEIRAADQAALRRLHDMLPHPRAALWWSDRPAGGLLGDARTLASGDDPAPLIDALHRGLFRGDIASAPALLPDEPPAPWRGVGPHGQGGKGMMGGKPYGRPLAMTADDLRDGLALDAPTLTIGPFTTLLPAGLVLDLVLQGDVVQRASVVRPPHPAPAHPCDAAVPALRALARLLALLDLPALADRCRRSAVATTAAEPVDLAALRAMLERSALLQAIPPGIGRIDARLAHALGLVERDTPADGTPIDLRWRVRRWLDRLTLPTAAAATDAAPLERLERTAGRLAPLLTGLEWQQALLVVASFDADALDLLCRPRDDERRHAGGDDDAGAMP